MPRKARVGFPLKVGGHGICRDSKTDHFLPVSANPMENGQGDRYGYDDESAAEGVSLRISARDDQLGPAQKHRFEPGSGLSGEGLRGPQGVSRGPQGVRAYY
jgi:hypothetical protein